ncbi:MAG: Rieske (2Fe-2S) protein, partial [Bacteroidota bacterium]
MEEQNRDLEWHQIYEATNMGHHFVDENGLKLVTVNGKKICLVRKGEELFAVRNRCPHAGGPLHQGFLNEKGDLVCPWHR